MGISKKILMAISRKYMWLKYGHKLGKCGDRVSLPLNCELKNPSCIYYENDVHVGNFSFFGPVLQYAGEFYSPKIKVGEKTIIGKYCSIAAIDCVEIGKNVLFAGHVHITDHSHGYEDITTPIAPQKLISKGPVIIEDDCWLGFSCEILSGVHIGKHSIVAARAVVTKDVPPYSIVAGNPARVVKQYNFETKQWEKVKK